MDLEFDPNPNSTGSGLYLEINFGLSQLLNMMLAHVATGPNNSYIRPSDWSPEGRTLSEFHQVPRDDYHHCTVYSMYEKMAPTTVLGNSCRLISSKGQVIIQRMELLLVFSFWFFELGSGV